MKEGRRTPFTSLCYREVKEGRGPFTPLFWPQIERVKEGSRHKPSGEGRPRSFHPSVLATHPEVKTGPFTPRSCHPSVLATNREVKEARGLFTPLFYNVLAANRVVKEGRAPFTPRLSRKAAVLSPLCFGHTPKGEGRPRSFHPADLATNQEVKEGCGPFTPRFWPQTER